MLETCVIELTIRMTQLNCETHDLIIRSRDSSEKLSFDTKLKL